ncbi:hypothetical protein [Streptococcus fryi]
MTYLTETEFSELGFDEVSDFSKLCQRAKIVIDLYTQGIYQKGLDFETDYDYRKRSVKLAMAFQIAYFDVSGILSADDKQALSSVSIGRTKIDYRHPPKGASQQFNISIDAENALKSAGFSLIVGVDYDR